MDGGAWNRPGGAAGRGRRSVGAAADAGSTALPCCCSAVETGWVLVMRCAAGGLQVEATSAEEFLAK